MNITGIRGEGDNSFPNAFKADNVDIPDICATASRPPAFNNVLRCKVGQLLLKQIYVYIHVITNRCCYRHINAHYKVTELMQ